MKILIFNWRDIKNPSSGGAEILTHEISKRWVKKGHSVTLFTSLFKEGLKEEILDGVNIVRRGHPDARYLFWSVHFLAFLYYFINFRGKCDVVVDEIHGLPFFTPLYVREKKVAIICEVAGKLWTRLYGPFYGLLGRLTELLYLQLIYRNITFLTISESSKNDLIKDGVAKKNIRVVPMGFTVPKSQNKFSKERNLTIIYVGRISKSKGIEDAILAFKSINEQIPKSKLWIIGRGEKKYVEEICRIIKKFSLVKKVILYGYVSEEKKFELMSRAHILVSTSHKEGFGLVIPEAGSVYTPAVVYSAPGLSEVVVDEVSGLICKKNIPEELSDIILNLTNNKPLYTRLSKGAYKESSKYTWDKTSKSAMSALVD